MPKAKAMEFDFSKAPPAQGGGTDHIPPGPYQVRAVKAAETKSNEGKPQVTVNFKVTKGEQADRRLTERFTMPTSDKDSAFGLQKLHAMLLAMGFKVDTKKKMKLQLATIEGKTCMVEVRDNTYETGKGDKKRTVVTSQIDTFIIGGKSKASDDDDDEDEDDDASEDEDEDTDDDDTDEEDGDDDDEDESEEDDEDDDSEDEDDESEDDADDEDEDDDDEDDEDEDEDEPEPEPVKSKKKASTTAAKKGTKAAAKAQPKAPAKKKGKGKAPASTDEWPV